MKMKWLDNGRSLAIFFIVLLHTSALVITNTSMHEPIWNIAIFYDSLTRWGVPVFVIISGYLLLDPSKNETWEDYYKKRFAKILIPLIFWTIFYMLWKIFIASLDGTGTVTYVSLFKSLLAGKPYYHLWFLYMIIFFYVFVPIIRRTISVMTKNELIIGIIFLFILSMINTLYGYVLFKNKALFFTWFLSYLPYFLTGISIRLYYVNKKINILLLTIIGSTIALTYFGTKIISFKYGIAHGLYFYDPLSITVVPMSIAIFLLFKNLLSFTFINVEITKKFAYLSFGIYLIHPIYLDIVKIYFMPFLIDETSIFNIFLISVLIYIASTLSAIAINKISFIRKII